MIDDNDFYTVIDYWKTFYDVLLPSGEVVINCWPNAGFYCATDGSGRKWGCEDVLVRPSEWSNE